MKITQLFSAIGLATYSVNTFGATCSCAGVPLLNSMSSSSVEQRQWFVNVSYEQHEMNRLYSGSDEVKDETNRNRSTDSMIVQTDYGINEFWSVSTMVSYVDHQREIGSSTNSFSSASGLGDGLLLFKYTPKKIDLFSKWQYSLGAGVKIPLGEDDAKENGVTVSEDLQPSSGSYSALTWAYLGYAFEQSGQTQIFISSHYSFNQENRRNYTNGNEFNLVLGASYSMMEKWGFAAQLRYRTTQADERNGDDIANTGGSWVDFIPSVQYRINDKSAVNFGVRIPVHRNLQGALQFTTSSAATLGFSYGF